MDINAVDQIAQSQFVWAILFICLAVIAGKYLISNAEKQEKRLTELYEESRKRAIEREQLLMEQLKTSNELQNEIVKAIEEIASDMSQVNSTLRCLESGMKDELEN